MTGLMTTALRAAETARPAHPPQAETDAQLLELWLHGRSAHTRRAYRADVGRFLAFAGKPLRQVTLSEVQAQLGHARIDTTTISTKPTTPERRAYADRVTW